MYFLVTTAAFETTSTVESKYYNVICDTIRAGYESSMGESEIRRHDLFIYIDNL